MAISSLSPSSSLNFLSGAQDQTRSAIDGILGQLSQLLGGAQGQDGQQNPLAAMVEQIKKALESGQLSPQDALQALQQVLQQATGQTNGSQPVSPTTGGSSNPVQPQQPGFSPQDQFSNQQPPNVEQPQEHHARHRGHRHAVAAAANAMGMSPHELRSQLRDGKSIADVARERGIDPKQVQEAVKTQLQRRMQDASDEQLTSVADRIVNEQRTPPVNPNAEVISATNFTNQRIAA